VEASHNDSCAPEASNTCTSGTVDLPKESVSLDAKRAFPYRIYGSARPGRTAGSTAVPSVLLTRKGSQVQPCRAHHIGSDQRKRCRAPLSGCYQPKRWLVRCLRGRSRDGVSDGERFPCLTSLFMARTRSSAPSSRTWTPRTARPGGRCIERAKRGLAGHAPGGRPQLARKSELGVFDTSVRWVPSGRAR
jgi:hypothetical protein